MKCDIEKFRNQIKRANINANKTAVQMMLKCSWSGLDNTRVYINYLFMVLWN